MKVLKILLSLCYAFRRVILKSPPRERRTDYVKKQIVKSASAKDEASTLDDDALGIAIAFRKGVRVISLPSHTVDVYLLCTSVATPKSLQIQIHL